MSGISYTLTSNLRIVCKMTYQRTVMAAKTIVFSLQLMREKYREVTKDQPQRFN